MAGRPKKIGSEKKDPRVTFNCTPGEMNKLAAMVHRSGKKSTAEFLRDRVFGGDAPRVSTDTDSAPQAPASAETVKETGMTAVAIQNLVSALAGKQPGSEALAAVEARLCEVEKLLTSILNHQNAMTETQKALIEIVKKQKSH
jgi:hypothetical protein